MTTAWATVGSTSLASEIEHETRRCRRRTDLTIHDGRVIARRRLRGYGRGLLCVVGDRYACSGATARVVLSVTMDPSSHYFLLGTYYTDDGSFR